MTYTNIMHDGQFLAGPFTENLAFEFLLKHQGQSVSYALTYGGYSFAETEDAPSMGAEDIFIGRLANGDRVYVNVELRRCDGTGKQTVTHESAPSEYLEFAASGLLVEPRRRMENAYSAGQNLDALTEIVEPARGFSLAEIGNLHKLWIAWHLNGMKAGCKHVPASDVVYRENPRYGYKELDLDATPRCPDVTGHGYKYGSAWLVDPLPATVVHSMQKLIRKLISLA